MKPATIYIVDDDADLLEYLSVALSGDDFDVLTYGSAQEFLTVSGGISGQGCVLLDINMPQMSGFQLHQELNSRGFSMPVIFLTAHADVPMAVKAMQNGAVDFIQKPVQPDELLACVHNVIDTPQKNLPSAEEAKEVKKTVDGLTPREREVMHLIVQGASNKEAAQSLDISPRTVEIYRATVMRKMNAQSLPDLVRKAIAIGL